MAFVEVDGSIAWLFRNCRQSLRELYHSLLKLPQDAQDASEGQRCSDEIGRLDMWDTETGASEGHLDHALRLSSRLRDGVVELLQDLGQLSAEGMASKIARPDHLLTLPQPWRSSHDQRISPMRVLRPLFQSLIT